jgi:hypothetical protein
MPSVEGSVPLLGKGLDYLNQTNETMLQTMANVTAPGPSPRTFYTGPMCLAIVDQPEHVQKILSSRHCTDKIYIYKFFFDSGELLKFYILSCSVGG